MQLTYEQLKAERNRLKSILDKASDMKGRPTYQAVRLKYDKYCEEIKKLFRK